VVGDLALGQYTIRSPKEEEWLLESAKERQGGTNQRCFCLGDAGSVLDLKLDAAVRRSKRKHEAWAPDQAARTARCGAANTQTRKAKGRTNPDNPDDTMETTNTIIQTNAEHGSCWNAGKRRAFLTSLWYRRACDQTKMQHRAPHGFLRPAGREPSAWMWGCKKETIRGKR